MWIYEKRLQYPVNITKTDARIAKIIASQYGGPDGEIGASMRYLSQRFTAPNRVCMAVLTDVATEELGTPRNGIYDRSSADCQPHRGRD